MAKVLGCLSAAPPGSGIPALVSKRLTTSLAATKTATYQELANAKGYQCDVTDEAQLDSTIDAIRRDLGTPKVLIHNAVGGAFGNFMEIERSMWNAETLVEERLDIKSVVQGMSVQERPAAA